MAGAASCTFFTIVVDKGLFMDTLDKRYRPGGTGNSGVA